MAQKTIYTPKLIGSVIFNASSMKAIDIDMPSEIKMVVMAIRMDSGAFKFNIIDDS